MELLTDRIPDASREELQSIIHADPNATGDLQRLLPLHQALAVTAPTLYTGVSGRTPRLATRRVNTGGPCYAQLTNALSGPDGATRLANHSGNQSRRNEDSTGQLELIPPFKKSHSDLLGGGEALNDLGTAVGYARTGNWSFEGFKLTADGDMQPYSLKVVDQRNTHQFV